MSGIKETAAMTNAALKMVSVIDELLTRGKRSEADAMRRLAKSLNEIKDDLQDGKIPRQNGYGFIAFLNTNEDKIEKLDKKYAKLHLGAMMAETRRLVTWRTYS